MLLADSQPRYVAGAAQYRVNIHLSPQERFGGRVPQDENLSLGKTLIRGVMLIRSWTCEIKLVALVKASHRLDME